MPSLHGLKRDSVLRPRIQTSGPTSSGRTQEQPRLKTQNPNSEVTRNSDAIRLNQKSSGKPQERQRLKTQNPNSEVD